MQKLDTKTSAQTCWFGKVFDAYLCRLTGVSARNVCQSRRMFKRPLANTSPKIGDFIILVECFARGSGRAAAASSQTQPHDECHRSKNGIKPFSLLLAIIHVTEIEVELQSATNHRRCGFNGNLDVLKVEYVLYQICGLTFHRNAEEYCRRVHHQYWDRSSCFQSFRACSLCRRGKSIHRFSLVSASARPYYRQRATEPIIRTWLMLKRTATRQSVPNPNPFNFYHKNTFHGPAPAAIQIRIFCVLIFWISSVENQVKSLQTDLSLQKFAVSKKK